MVKIVTIGGGSSYTPELIEGFINRQDEIDIKEIWLVDIEAGKEKLEIVGEMAKRMVKAAGLDWPIYLTLDRREALKEADFVTTQFRVGQLDARIKDEKIPAKYNQLGQETNGAGGIFKAFRTIPVIQSIIKDMKELCPNAWLVNFTNPAGIITETAIKHLGWKKTVGLCNMPIGSIKRCHRVMDLPEDSNELFIKFAGINHFHWHRVWDKEGKEITQEIINKLYMSNQIQTSEVVNIKPIDYNYEQLKSLGLLPCGYHRYYYVTKEMLDESIADYQKGQTRAEVVKRTESELFELYKNPNLDYKPEQLDMRGGAFYSDAACELIVSIINDKRNIMVVSTQNNGAIHDLPYDSIVEISSIITSHGPEPINWGNFKPSARGMLQQMKAMEELVIEAGLNGDYNVALQAFTSNPLIQNGFYIKDMLNELLMAHKEHLPQFKSTIGVIG